MIKHLCNCIKAAWTHGDKYKDATYMYEVPVNKDDTCIYCGYVTFRSTNAKIKEDSKIGAKIGRGALEYRQFERKARVSISDWHKKDKPADAK